MTQKQVEKSGYRSKSKDKATADSSATLRNDKKSRDKSRFPAGMKIRDSKPAWDMQVDFTDYL
jgi:hypothetical protein